MSRVALSVVEELERENPRSRAAYERARRLFPSGVTHDVRHAEPFPLLVQEARGAWKLDADGHWLVDYVCGHGALLLGHGHPAVVDAIRRQAPRGLHLGASTAEEAAWAEQVIALVPSAERVRFTSSGTEATLLALRVARGFTGRSRVVKLGGHFHGWHDDVSPGVALPVEAEPPLGSPPNPDLTVVPAGDLDALAAELDRGDVAALILEPSGAAWGAVPLPQGYLAGARALCCRSGTLLVFDEVVTGFRWSPGGVQGLTGVVPDLTSLAKVLAGGLPGGAVAGRAEVVDVLAFREGRKVEHPGTHNGHPLAAVAGTASLQLLADGRLGEGADARAAQLRRALNDVLQRRGIPGFAYGQSSTFCLILGHEAPGFTGGDLRDPGVDPVVLKAGISGPLLTALQCAMLLEGVHLFHGCGLLGVAHGDEELERTVAAFDAALGRLGDEGLL